MTDAKLDPGLFTRLDDVNEVLDATAPDIFLDRRSIPARIIACPICHGYCHNHTRHNLTPCPGCGHVFQTDMTVTVSYDADYAHQYDSRPVKEMSDVRWNFIQAHLDLPVGSKILDVGYGNGAFLKRARTAGMKIYGIDVHSEDFGVPNVDFDTSLEFDLICFFDSLEHFPNFEPIYRLRSRNVIVSIPNTPSLLLARPMAWRHYKPGEHLHYFSRTSLDSFMRNWGFPRKLTEGYPEDELRGKLVLDQQSTDNIYTALYTNAAKPSV